MEFTEGFSSHVDKTDPHQQVSAIYKTVHFRQD
jgi:hypothetical protein